MDRDIPLNRRRRNMLIGAVKVTVAMLIAVAIYLIVRSKIEPTITMDRVDVATVIRSDIYQTVSASGVVETEFNRPILAPVSAVIEQVITIPGSEVKRGDTILILGEEAIIEQIATVEEEIARKVNALEKNILNSSGDSLSKEFDRLVIEGEISSLQRQLEGEEFLLKLGGVAEDIPVKTRQKLLQTQKKLSVSEQRAEIEAKLQRLEQQSLKIDIEAAKRRLHRERESLSRCAVISPIDGVIISISTKIGEMAIESSKLIEVADLSSYKISATISDSRADKIMVGKVAFIDIGKRRVNGVVTNIRPEVNEGRIRFDIKLDNPREDNLLPNQKVEVEVSTNSKRDVLTISNGVFYSGEQHVDIFVVKDNLAEKRNITIGLDNSKRLEVMDKLEEGDTVIISDMSQYKMLDKVKIEL